MQVNFQKLVSLKKEKILQGSLLGKIGNNIHTLKYKLNS